MLSLIKTIDLSGEARILYASDSVVDVLGFTPDEVVNRPCWDFFHPNTVEDAKRLHSRGVELDKAAVLVYCSLLHRDRRAPVMCECCFTCVYNVMVVCTSLYHPGIESQRKLNHAFPTAILLSSSQSEQQRHRSSDAYSVHPHWIHVITCYHICPQSFSGTLPKKAMNHELPSFLIASPAPQPSCMRRVGSSRSLVSPAKT